jgi:hypothetical protein
MDKELINRIKELKEIEKEITTSDLQGIVEVIAREINKNKSLEIEEYLLNYVYGEIDLNKCLELLKGG